MRNVVNFVVALTKSSSFSECERARGASKKPSSEKPAIGADLCTKPVAVESPYEFSLAEIAMAVKHPVLERDELFSKMQRDIERFERREGAWTRRAKRFPRQLACLCGRVTRAGALSAATPNNWSTTTSFRSQKAAATPSATFNCSVRPAIVRRERGSRERTPPSCCSATPHRGLLLELWVQSAVTRISSCTLRSAEIRSLQRDAGTTHRRDANSRIAEQRAGNTNAGCRVVRCSDWVDTRSAQRRFLEPRSGARSRRCSAASSTGSATATPSSAGRQRG